MTTTADRLAPVLGVEQAMGLARQAVESIVPGPVWLTGEVSGLTKSRAGHTYFSLHPAGNTSLSISVAMIGLEGHHIHAALRNAGVELRDGISIKVRGTLTVWPRRGSLQLTADLIDWRSIAPGRSAAAVVELRSQLEAQGQLGRQQALSLPDVPCRVLVVGPAGQGVEDVRATLAASPWAWQVTLATVSVEVEGGPRNLAEAISRGSGHDVVVLARGGGSMIRHPYDAEWTCRAICASPVPVVVAVGHTTDRTLADECGWRSVVTPTASAELLIGHLATADQRIVDALAACERAADAVIARAERAVAAELAGCEAAASQVGMAHEARSAALAADSMVGTWRTLALVGGALAVLLMIVLLIVH